MATFKNVGLVDYEIVGDGTQPAQVVEPGGTVERRRNPNGPISSGSSGDPPDGAGDFNDPDYQPTEPDDPNRSPNPNRNRDPAAADSEE